MRLVLLCFFLSPSWVSAQSDTTYVKPRDRFSVNGGLAFSAINILRNENDRYPKTGFNFRLNYRLEEALWTSAEYTHSFTFSSRTWQDIKSRNYDLNIFLAANLDNPRARPYGLVGLGMHKWSATFTGEHDYHNWRKIYDINERVEEQWYLINFGAGYLQYWESFGVQGDFRFRLSGTELGFNISDVVYTVTFMYFPGKKFLKPGRVYKWI